MKLLKKWRTSHGFGVHSPFAYNFITKVLREYEAHYYAYGEIDSLCPQMRRNVRPESTMDFSYAIPDARLLFRVLCRFNPGQIIEVGNGHEVTNTIITRAIPRAKRVRWVREREIEYLKEGFTFVLVNQMRQLIYDDVLQMILDQAKRPEGIVVFVRNIHWEKPSIELWNDLIARKPCGMDFSNGHVGIICMLPGLPCQSYELFF